MYDS
jgi:hypothetical protein